MSKGAERKGLLLKDADSSENETDTETVQSERVFQGPGMLMAALTVALGGLDWIVWAVRRLAAQAQAQTGSNKPNEEMQR